MGEIGERCRNAGWIEIAPGQWMKPGAPRHPKDHVAAFMYEREEVMKHGQRELGTSPQEFKEKLKRELRSPGFLQKLVAVREGRRTENATG